MEKFTKENKRTTPESSDISGVGDLVSIVPAHCSSSSYAGLPQVLPAGARGELDTAVIESDSEIRSQSSGHRICSQVASSAIISRSNSQVSLHSSCNMEIEKESRKRNREEMSKGDSDKGGQEDESEEEIRILAKRKTRVAAITARSKFISDDDGASSNQEDAQLRNIASGKTDPILITSDLEEVECSADIQYIGKELTGGKVGLGMEVNESKGGIEVQESKKEFGVQIKKKRGRKRKIRRKKIGMDALGVHEIEDSDNSKGYDALSASEMAATAIEYLEEADEIRIKCKNTKGDLSGIMKRRIHNAKEIIKGLAKTVTQLPTRKEEGEVSDEACFLRMENKELQARLKEKKRNCLQKEKEIQLLRNEIKELSEQMSAIRKEVMSIKENKNKNKEGSPIFRSNRKTGRIERTLEAIGRGEDTSVADDSEVMDVEYPQEYAKDWSVIDEGQTFKKPLPVPEGNLTSKSTSRGSAGKSSYLERLQHDREEQSVKQAMEESLQDIKEIRDNIRRKGTLRQVIGQEEILKQRTPRLVKPRRTDWLVLKSK